MGSIALTPETKNSSERFKHFVSDEQLSEMSKGYTPQNTEASRTSAISYLGLKHVPKEITNEIQWLSAPVF